MTWMIISGLIVGVLLGFVMQRTRFCLAGGFRDMYVQKSNKMFYALLVAITVQSIGLLILTSFGAIKVPTHTFPVVGTIIGSFIFGIGIVLSGGCATGTWYRAGEGLIGSWVALILYAVTSAITKTGVLLPLMNVINRPTNVNASVSHSTGIPNWVLVLILTVITITLVVRTLRKPKVMVPKLKQKHTGIRHYLFERRYHPFVAGIVVGLIALLAWPMSESTGRPYGLGITTPSANLINFLVSGNSKFIDWGVLLVLGIFVGSYIAARGSKEFKWRLPDKKTIRNSAFGGMLMGFGASVAGGCSIGNGLVETATMSWQGWIGLGSMIIGVWFMSYFIFVKPMKRLQQTTNNKSQNNTVSQRTQTT
ncbi:YeeE/YedE family protein [Staphylococcus caprae M23864:W1]|uniref:YeeE/YedE family protein n=1 Tax=Staphylococcus caprae TaxID=29380 RepID=UPI0001AAC8C1|nr:YeeE/YedE family protein [Staphylococcus caprae]EES42181.1 YeeE/YedE family protein [Staphylococcus caprae M23864:W1]MBU5272890.1 YeeE/YedE family protein [Staphylococcus caprae]MDI0015407.1 YeeE/YedE family protein [Staphylococcus caprae]MDK6298549.1 YeeE/YedE family protein [Staphylococcus caprae]MDK7232128.1 YeeE/YedE family protein [Staphylococcus caprae]